MIYWSSFLLLFRVLVYILIKVTNFLRNKRFVYIFHGQKLCYLEKIEFVRKLMHFERDDAENVHVAKRRYIKTNEFFLYPSDKGICHCGVCGEERYIHQQSSTNATRQGHIVVKVLALRYKNIL